MIRNMKFSNLKMLFLYIIILTIIGVHVRGNSISDQDECKKRKADCDASTGELDTPVCGSDNKTYSSQCEVLISQCEGGPIRIKHHGPCTGIGPCEKAKLNPEFNSEPKCRDDGTFEAIQCDSESKFCWCVTPKGQVIDGTAVVNKKPTCIIIRGLVENNIRTQSSAELFSSLATVPSSSTIDGGSFIPDESKKKHYNRHRNACDTSEKSKFNNNLIENFKIEYRRANISTDDNNVELILSWKFITLDTDGDGHLDRSEYQELRRLARKTVRPKKCARTFARDCDADLDLKLSRQEWSACLSNNVSFGQHQVLQIQKTRAIDEALKEKPRKHNVIEKFNDDLLETIEDTDTSDCISDRNLVTEGQEHSKFYVPQCTPDGRYDKVQCYAGYCWCVLQDTGKPIPGTSSKDRPPNCDPVPTPTRPMKGCPEKKKIIFLKDLMDLMESTTKLSVDSVINSEKWSKSKEEIIATWHFVMLDKNKNKVLERKEWKNFRSMIIKNKNLKRCGKKLPRYCDVNNDRKISMTEWLSCLNAQHQSSEDQTLDKTLNATARRLGQNPLDQFLNSD